MRSISATDMAAATESWATETRMTGEASSMTSAETGMASAATVTASTMLRPDRYSQEKGERRDGHQAAHTGSLYARRETLQRQPLTRKITDTRFQVMTYCLLRRPTSLPGPR